MENKPSIRTISLIRWAEDEAEAEILKEFLHFIGCLVTDHTVDNEELNLLDAKLDARSSPHDVDLLMNINLESVEKPVFASDMQVDFGYSLKNEDSDSPYAFVDAVFNREYPPWTDRKAARAAAGFDKNTIEKQITKKKEVTRLLLRWLVGFIWHQDEDACDSLLKIVDLYVDNDLFFVLQEKRSLRVLHMTEALDWNIPLTQFCWDPYYGKMLNSLRSFLASLLVNKSDSHKETVYSIYVRVNAKRKIRELMDFLKGVPEANKESTIQKTPYYSTNELLSELESIREMDSDFSSLYFLAAYICRSSNENKIGPLDAYTYYRKFIEQHSSFGEFDAFIVDYFGTYYEKVLDDREKADLYFRSAVKANPNCYPAIFKVARAQARKSEYVAAKEKFLSVLNIVFMGMDWNVEESWKQLSLKKLQYAFKTCIWLAKIEKAATGNLKVVNRWIGNAALAATAYQENQCLQLCVEGDDASRILPYHERSVSVEALWIMVYKWADVLGDAFLMYIADQRRQKIAKNRENCRKERAV